MPRRSRPLTPAQRSAKIECDRRRRRDHKAFMESQANEINRLRKENERLNYMFPELQNTVHQQQEEIRQLHQHLNNLAVQEETKKLGKKGLGSLQNEVRELQGLVLTQSDEIARLTARVPCLQDTVNRQREMIRQLKHQKDLEEEDSIKLADSLFKIDEFPSPKYEAARDEYVAGGVSSAQNGIIMPTFLCYFECE